MLGWAAPAVEPVALLCICPSNPWHTYPLPSPLSPQPPTRPLSPPLPYPTHPLLPPSSPLTPPLLSSPPLPSPLPSPHPALPSPPLQGVGCQRGRRGAGHPAHLGAGGGAPQRIGCAQHCVQHPTLQVYTPELRWIRVASWGCRPGRRAAWAVVQEAKQVICQGFGWFTPLASLATLSLQAAWRRTREVTCKVSAGLHPSSPSLQAASLRTWPRRCSAAAAPTSGKTTSCTTRHPGCCSGQRRRPLQVGGANLWVAAAGGCRLSPAVLYCYKVLRLQQAEAATAARVRSRQCVTSLCTTRSTLLPCCFTADSSIDRRSPPCPPCSTTQLTARLWPARPCLSCCGCR